MACSRLSVPGAARRPSSIVLTDLEPGTGNLTRHCSLMDIFGSTFLECELLVMAGEERVMTGERSSICWDPGLLLVKRFTPKAKLNHDDDLQRPSILVSRLPHPLPQLSLKSLIPLVSLKCKCPNCKQWTWLNLQLHDDSELHVHYT